MSALLFIGLASGGCSSSGGAHTPAISDAGALEDAAPLEDARTVDSSPLICSPASCAGCCDAQGGCHTGDSVTACGVTGARCASCGTGESCKAGTCEGAPKVILFGGDDTKNLFNDTWTFDGSTWTEVTTATAPTPRQGHAMAQQGDRVVLFGGFDRRSGRPLADTWIFDAMGWHELSVAIPPEWRAWGAMAIFDGKPLLFGGFPGIDSLRDTWRLDGDTWTQIMTMPLRTPVGRFHHVMATLGSDVILFSGTNDFGVPENDMWKFDVVNQWQRLSFPVMPPARRNSALARLGSKLVLFAGTDPYNFLGDTWLFDGSAWTQVKPPVSPRAREGHAMATLGSQVVLFGGRDYDSGLSQNDTWLFDGFNWTRVTPPRSPSARYRHKLVGR